MADFVVVGAGGHAVVVVDALLLAGAHILGVVDADQSAVGRTLCGVRVVGDDSALSRFNRESTTLVNGIGGVGAAGALTLRQRVQERLEGLGWAFGSVCHPSAIVSPHATLEGGTHVFAGAVVQAGAEIRRGAIVNTAAIVEHDVDVGSWSHVAPGAVLCGDVSVAPGCHVGAGAVIKQGVRLGPGTLVGAGAVVVRDFAGPGVLVGVPARSAEDGT